jgi:redox-sensitive bicupin YhaK (pirin superfamily)
MAEVEPSKSEPMAILQLVTARQRDLGGFSVRRVLPAETQPMVGPFIFFDHLGPAQFAPGHGIDVRPHPHIALATVTYLFSGSLEHRDSLGNIREIRPGDVNWMTAGHGIAHSERTPRLARAAGEEIQGIQSWVALPDGYEDVDPEFTHYRADVIPQRVLKGVSLAVVAGECLGLRSPVATLWPTFYVHARFSAGAMLEAPMEHEERAVYVVHGELTLQDSTVSEGELAVLAPGSTAQLRSEGETRAMLFGGARFPTRRFIWWNFVASSRERIESAKERWAERRFPPVPGETEFIPLPHQ